MGRIAAAVKDAAAKVDFAEPATTTETIGFAAVAANIGAKGTAGKSGKAEGIGDRRRKENKRTTTTAVAICTTTATTASATATPCASET